MKKNMNWLLLAAVLMLGIAMAGVVTSSPTPVIRVEPKNNTAGVGETFAVNITVTGITEAESLYNWECRITFNPSILNAVNATEGLFLRNTGNKTFWSKKTNNTIGRVDIGAMLEIPLPPKGAVGNGTLATVTFKVVSVGTTAFELARTELYTTKGEAPNQYASPIWHSAEDGSFSSGGSALSQELIVVIVVIVAVGGGAGFLLYKRRRASKG